MTIWLQSGWIHYCDWNGANDQVQGRIEVGPIIGHGQGGFGAFFHTLGKDGETLTGFGRGDEMPGTERGDRADQSFGWRRHALPETIHLVFPLEAVQGNFAGGFVGCPKQFAVAIRGP